MTSDETLDDATLTAMREEFLDFCQDEHARVVRYLMVKFGTTAEEAWDATQDAFVAAWQLLTTKPQKWHEIGNRQAWIRRVARNVFMRPPGARQRPLTVPVAQVPEAPRDDDHTELSALTIDLIMAAKGLPEKEREVVALRIGGMRPIEIAREMEVNYQWVRDVLKKFRKIADPLLRPHLKERV